MKAVDGRFWRKAVIRQTADVGVPGSNLVR
jgi:hypothetical protein